jgi:hypothetical protein
MKVICAEASSCRFTCVHKLAHYKLFDCNDNCDNHPNGVGACIIVEGFPTLLYDEIEEEDE